MILLKIRKFQVQNILAAPALDFIEILEIIFPSSPYHVTWVDPAGLPKLGHFRILIDFTIIVCYYFE